MKIIVNDIAASSGGALTILKSLYKHITESKEAQKHTWVFLLSDYYLEERDNIEIVIYNDVKRNWIRRLYFDLFQGKKVINQLKPDVVLSLQNTAIFGLNYPQVIYLHQSIPFQKIKKFSFFKRGEFQLAIYQYLIGSFIKSSLTKVKHVIVQTKWMKDTILEQEKFKKINITNILPPQNELEVDIQDVKFEKNSFFYPAGNFIYKNHSCLNHAVEILKHSGIDDFEVKLTTESEKNVENIKFLGKMSYDSVIKEYKKSTLVFPSYIETIGLPLLEARKMGALILASDTPFSREALVDYPNAYFFDPFNPKELSNLMSKVIKGKIRKVNSTKEQIKTSGWEGVIEILEKEGNKK